MNLFFFLCQLTPNEAKGRIYAYKCICSEKEKMKGSIPVYLANKPQNFHIGLFTNTHKTNPGEWLIRFNHNTLVSGSNTPIIQPNLKRCYILKISYAHAHFHVTLNIVSYRRIVECIYELVGVCMMMNTNIVSFFISLGPSIFIKLARDSV